jgi:YbbR domain-containing protein
VTIEPSQIRVTQNITQLGGYRNVVVKVITMGQVAGGYRVTNISVFPPAVTLFSDDPGLVDEVPGYVETFPLDLTGVKDDMDLFLSLNLPPGVSVVGDQDVEVQVGIAAIEGSITLENMPVTVIGLSPGLKAEISPQQVDVILSGPLPALDSLRASDVQIIVNVDGLVEGVYQRIPQIDINEDIRVQSVLQ